MGIHVQIELEDGLLGVCVGKIIQPYTKLTIVGAVISA